MRPYCFGRRKDPRGRGGADWPLGLCRPAPAVLVMARKLRPALACAPPRRSRRLPHNAPLAEGRTEPDFEPAEPNDRAVVVVGRCSCRPRLQCARTAAFRRAARMCRSIASRCAPRPSPETPCLSVETRRYEKARCAGLARGLQGRSPGHFPSFNKSKPGNTNPNARLTVRHTSRRVRSPPRPGPLVADIYVQGQVAGLYVAGGRGEVSRRDRYRRRGRCDAVRAGP